MRGIKITQTLLGGSVKEYESTSGKIVAHSWKIIFKGTIYCNMLKSIIKHKVLADWKEYMFKKVFA